MNGPYFGALKTMDQVAHSPLRSRALELHKALEGEISDRAKGVAAAFLEAIADEAEATPSQKFIAASVKNVYEHTRKQTRQAPVLSVGLEALINLSPDLVIGVAAKLLADCRLPEIASRNSGPVYRECLQELPRYTQSETEKNLTVLALHVAEHFPKPIPQALFLHPAIDLLGRNMTAEASVAACAAYGFAASHRAENKHSQDFGDAYPTGMLAAKKVGDLVMDVMQAEPSTAASAEAVVQAQRECFAGALHRHPRLLDHLKHIGLPAPAAP